MCIAYGRRKFGQSHFCKGHSCSNGNLFSSTGNCYFLQVHLNHGKTVEKQITNETSVANSYELSSFHFFHTSPCYHTEDISFFSFLLNDILEISILIYIL